MNSKQHHPDAAPEITAHSPASAAHPHKRPDISPNAAAQCHHHICRPEPGVWPWGSPVLSPSLNVPVPIDPTNGSKPSSEQ